MKNLKTTILSAFIAFSCLTNGIAQENKLKASDGKKGHKKVVLSLGGGTSMPSSDGKDKAFLSNSTAINADLFLPLIRKGWDGGGARDHVKGHKMDFGLNVGGTYNFGGSGGFGTTPNPFAVTGQTSSMVSDRCQCTGQAEFRMGVGPQANFYFGKFIVSPMVLGEYFSMTQKEMSIVQTTQFNGQSYDFNLVTMPENKTSGIAVTPKLRLNYMISQYFGLFADASYTTGPKIETTVSKLIPNGNPSPQSGSYNIQQLQTGTMVKGETKSTAYRAMGFNFGVVINFGKPIKPTCTCCGSIKHSTGECSKCVTNTTSSSDINHTKDLTEDMPSYCGCCKQAGHTASVCIIPCTARVKNKTKSNSTNERTAGDIKKGWDGTVKGLFATVSKPNNATTFITIDEKGELTQVKKIEFENEITNKFPQAENIQSQIKTSDDIPYVETQFTYKGKQIFILRKIELTKSKFVIVKEYAVACNGKCNGQTYNCNMVLSAKTMEERPYKCNCETPNCKFRVVDVTGGIKVTEFENEIFTKEE